MVEQIDFSSNSIVINPNFIYNRIDLFSKNCILLHVKNDNNDYMLEAQLFAKHAVLGVWMMKVSGSDFEEISRFIFNKYKNIEFLSFYNAVSDKTFIAKRHYSIILPESYDSIEMRISAKSRYNMRRMKKMAEKEYGKVIMIEYIQDEITDEIVSLYYKMKKQTLNIDYNLSYKDYIIRYHVTNVYMLCYGEKVAALLFTCEQCPIVYLENLAYDSDLAKFSPGMMAYDMMLEKLIEKGKTSLFLGGGDYDYKKKYDSIETTVTEGKIYRSTPIKFKYTCIDFYNKHLYWKVKRFKSFLSL